MLGFIRKWLTSWPVLALLGLVLVAFVITGVGDPFGSRGGAGGDMARVGKTGITEAAFLKQFDRIVGRARETSPGTTPQQVAREGGVEQVLDQMVGSAALDEFAAAHKVAASKRAVDGAIASIDAFRLGGKFDQATYQRLLAERRLSEAELRTGLASDLVRKQLLVPVASGAMVPRTIAMPYARLLLDLHEGQGGVVPPPAVAAPSPAAVAAYYAAHKAQFMAPEKRGFRFAMLDRDALASAAIVTDAEVAAYYEKNRETYGGVEQRTLSQVVLPDEGRAKAFVAAVRGGTNFVEAAQKLAGYKAADVALGLFTKDEYALASSPAAADAVFAAPAGSVVDPVKTDFGWNVVRVDSIAGAKGKSLADLKGEITAKLRGDKADTALSELVAKIEDGFGEGKSFADVVKEHKLTPVTVPPVARDGAGLPPATVPVVAKAFDADPADKASVQEVAKGQFAVLELGQVVSPAAPPLAQITPQVTAALTASLRGKAAQAIADAVIAEVAKGGNFAAALVKRALPPAQPIKGRRLDASQAKQVPPPVALFLTMPAGATRSLAATDGSVVLIHVDRIIPGDLASAPPLLEASRQQLAQLAPDELTTAFGRAVEREVGVKINRAAVAAATRRIVGEAAPAAQ